MTTDCGMAAMLDRLVRGRATRVPVLLEDRAVLRHGAVADIFPRVVAVENDVEGVVARVERVDDRQAVRIERRLDLLALEAQAQRGDGVLGPLLGRELRLGGSVCRIARRKERLAAVEQLLQRVDQHALRVGEPAQRISLGHRLDGLLL